MFFIRHDLMIINVSLKSQKLQLSHWMGLVDEFFLASATLKLTLWKDNQKVEAKVFGVS